MSHTYHSGFVSSHHLKSEILDCPFWRIPTCHHPRMSLWIPFSLHGLAFSICCRHMNPLWKHFYFLYAGTLYYHVQGSLVHYHPMFRCLGKSVSLSWMRPSVAQEIQNWSSPLVFWCMLAMEISHGEMNLVIPCREKDMPHACR